MAKKDGKGKASEAPRQIQNRRARFEYEFIESFEAGIMLVGSEVKSVFLGRVNMTDAFCRILNGELWMLNLDIEPYDHASAFQPERRRDRKLLMHRKQIDTLQRKSQEKGLTIIPSRMYFNHGKVKVEVNLAKGKSQFDKRDKIAKDDARRETERIQTKRMIKY
jgi:SsrA-binding protein